MEELGAGVEGGGRVLVSLEDEGAALSRVSQASGGREVPGGGSQPEPRGAAGHLQHEGRQGRGGGLAVGPTDHRALSSLSESPVGLSLAEERQAPVPGRDQLRVAGLDLVPQHHQLGHPPAVEVGLVMVGAEGNARRLQGLGGGRIGVLIGAGDPEAQLLAAERQPRDRVAADAQEVQMRGGCRPAPRRLVSQAQPLWPASSARSAATSKAALGLAIEALALAIARQRRGSPRTSRTAPSSSPAVSS